MPPFPSSGAAPAFWALPGPAVESAVSVRPGNPGNGQVVRVGFLGPLTGSSAAYGLSCRRGIELALRDAEAAAPGSRFELVAVDDEGDEAKAGAGAVRLAHEENVVTILGAVNSASTHVAARVAAMAGCPQITSVSTDPALTRTNNRWLFRNLADDNVQGAALARYLFDSRGVKRLALVHDDNRYGRGGAKVILAEAERRGRQPVLVQEFARGTTDFGPLAETIASARPDGVVVWGLFGEAADLVKALAARGVQVPVAGGDGLVSPAFLERAGAAAEGVVVTYPFDAAGSSAPTRGFVERYRVAYGSEPDSFAAHSYDAAAAVVRAVREAGADREKVRAALAASASEKGVAGPVGFDASGNATSPVQLAVVQNGRFRPLGFETGATAQTPPR